MTNWAGNVTYRAARRHRPSTVDELRRIVAGATRVRALGTGHSFTPLVDAPGGDLVSLAGLPSTMDIDTRARTVRVAAGLRYGDAAPRLHEAGYALPNLASLPHLSIAGACATGTHGSGDRLGTLATSVSALELVTAGGDLLRLDRRDARFPGAVVALGTLGVVTHLTLDLVGAYEVAQHVYEGLPFDRLLADLDAIFASAYSVSVFTDWALPTVDVWVKRRTTDAPAPDLAAEARTPRHPIAGEPPGHCTPQLGEPGPWYARLPHFRLEFTPSHGAELQSEYLVPRDRAVEALAALHAVRAAFAPLVLVGEIRTVAADDLWLSPAYRRDCLAIHWTWRPDEPGVRRALGRIEERLEPFAPRPHWGKLHHTPQWTRFPRRADFAALRDALDPAGTFQLSTG